MYTDFFNEFLMSRDNLRVYKGNQSVFSSSNDGLLPLLEYIDHFIPYHQQVVVFDKIMGNAAALLSIKAGCQQIYSPLGSQLAINTLHRYGIEYHLTKIIPYIQTSSYEHMCPMERLSIDKNPEEFYEAIRNIMSRS